MISFLTGVVIAFLMSLVAAYKGRTGWHWFGLTLLAFATFGTLSAIALHFSGIQISIAAADRQFAAFDGAMTCAVILITLVAVPSRLKRRPAWRKNGRRSILNRD